MRCKVCQPDERTSINFDMMKMMMTIGFNVSFHMHSYMALSQGTPSPLFGVKWNFITIFSWSDDHLDESELKCDLSLDTTSRNGISRVKSYTIDVNCDWVTDLLWLSVMGAAASDFKRPPNNRKTFEFTSSYTSEESKTHVCERHNDLLSSKLVNI